MNNYQATFQKARRELAASLQAAKVEIAQIAAERIIRRTPEDTGLARGNWVLSVNAPELAAKPVAPGGIASVARAKRTLAVYRASGQPLSIVYIVNGLPYIGRLENGWSQQAPNGMVALTVAELPRIAETTIFTKLKQSNA